MLHLLHGADGYSASREADALVRRLTGGDLGAAIRLDGVGTSWNALREACLTMPLFSPVQVVLVRGLLGAWSGRGEGGRAGGQRPTPAEFASFVASLPQAAHLILLEGELPASNRYLKELGGLGEQAVALRAFAAPHGAERHRWITHAVHTRGGAIDQGAVALLAERAPADMWGLANEVEKLLAYTAPTYRIAAADVDALVPASEDATGFGLVDAVTAGDPRAVVDLTERLLAAGQAPEQILALLGARVRDLLLLVAGRREGVSPAEVGARVGWNPGRLGHLQRTQGRFAARDLVEAQALLVASDLALKSRPAHERPQIVLLTVLAIAQRRSSPELAQALAL